MNVTITKTSNVFQIVIVTAFILKNKIILLERELKDFEGCALAGHLMKAVFHRLNNYFQAIRGYTDLLISIDSGKSSDVKYLTKMSGAVDGSIDCF